MPSQDDKVSACLQGWAEFCRVIHTETWEEKRRDTLEALAEYRRKHQPPPQPEAWAT